MDTSTRRTVLVAGAANVIIAIAKLAAGILAGSAAMLAEAAHSLADTMNQGFLLASLYRSDRPADAAHPFGYGKERYFWSLLAAVGIFVAGGGFSIFEGVLTIDHGGRSTGAVFAFAVLAIAVVAEGSALIRAVRQLRREASSAGHGLPEYVRRSPDTTLRAVVFEDTTALIGLVVAAAGLTLRELTGSAFWDGAASILIGVLLVSVAYSLGRTNMHMLIGRSASPEQRQLITDEIEAAPGVDVVLELLTMHLAPDELIVAARVAFNDDISADDAENVADEVDRSLRDRLPTIRHVFLDPTQRVTS
jgi:cation diffusion facilitator family transporter